MTPGIPATEGERNRLARYLRWEADQRGPCPVCGAELRLLTAAERGWKPVRITPEGFEPGKRFGVLHDYYDHRRAGIAPVGHYQA